MSFTRNPGSVVVVMTTVRNVTIKTSIVSNLLLPKILNILGLNDIGGCGVFN